MGQYLPESLSLTTHSLTHSLIVCVCMHTHTHLYLCVCLPYKVRSTKQRNTNVLRSETASEVRILGPQYDMASKYLLYIYFVFVFFCFFFPSAFRSFKHQKILLNIFYIMPRYQKIDLQGGICSSCKGDQKCVRVCTEKVICVRYIFFVCVRLWQTEVRPSGYTEVRSSDCTQTTQRSGPHFHCGHSIRK